MFENVRHILTGERRDRPLHARAKRDPDLDEIVDRLAHMVSPKIVAVRDYRRRLREPVQQAMDYFRRAADSLAEPMVLARERWFADPLLNACFASVEELEAFLRNDSALRGFAAQARAGRAFFLLTMSRREDHVLGCGIRGQTLCRDVPQTVETFTDHRALAVTASLVDTKAGLVWAGLERLAATAAAHVTRTHKRIEELERVRTSLKHEMKLLRLESQGLGQAFVDEETRRKLSQGEQVMREINSDLAQARSEFVEPSDYLEFAVHVFEEPAECIAFKQVTLELTREGVVGDGYPGAPSRPVSFMEIRLPDRTRAAVLAECAVADIPAGRA